MAWTGVLETLELCIFSCLTITVRTFIIIDLIEVSYNTKEAAFVPLFLGVRHNYSAVWANSDVVTSLGNCNQIYIAHPS